MNYVAKALIYNQQGQVLVLTRSDTHPRYPLHDDLPGGEVEPGEANDLGMQRELDEEIGISFDANSLKLLATTLHKSTMTYLLYEGTLTDNSQVVTLSWEHSDYRWSTIDELIQTQQPENVDSYFQFVLEHLAKEVPSVTQL